MLVMIVTMEVVVLKVIGKLGDCLDSVVVGQRVWGLPEGTVSPLHGYHGWHHWEYPAIDLIHAGGTLISPVEWPVNASGNEKPVYDGRPVACPHQVDIVGVSRRVLLRHPADQLQDEAHVVRLASLWNSGENIGLGKQLNKKMNLIVHVPAPLVTTGCHNHLKSTKKK